MDYLYLLINLGVIAGPLALSFDKKVAFYKNWKFLFPAIGFMMLLFIPWDILFTYLGVWSFNPDYISDINIGNLPLGEFLFFVTIPYACVFTYECLNIYFPNKFLIAKPFYIIIAFIVFCLVIYGLYFDKLYTGYTALIALLVLVLQLYTFKKVNYIGYFYRAFFVLVIPMFLVNGILTAKPIVQYNEMEKTPFRLGSIPWEDFIYNLIMLYMVVAFYEYLKSRVNRAPKEGIE